MRVLYVVGSCLTKNTSANMSHNGYVQGLLENGCDVDIIMSSNSWGEQDAALPVWKNAHYFVYNSVSSADRIKKALKKANKAVPTARMESSTTQSELKNAGKHSLHDIGKKLFYQVFPNDPLYPLEKTWLINAKKFSEVKEYDLVISNSSPAASHALVLSLLESGNISCKRWVQIWEDPWYYDIYGDHSKVIREEERRLLRAATEVRYVSPLTLEYQRKLFPDYAEKMKFIPLPALQYGRTCELPAHQSPRFGYFGDYYSKTRNLCPFYEAMREMGAFGYIYGDTDLYLESDEKLDIHGRVTLDKLAKVQAQTDVLVHLCNLHGGQIPGKIYHYSVTNKPILFILDGTEEEIQCIHAFFSKYNRYFFCENTVQSIKYAIGTMLREKEVTQQVPVADFFPNIVVNKLIENQ